MSRVVLVTGCSKGGIGFYLCEQFAEEGCTVYATSRNPDTLEGFQHGGIKKLALDVTSDHDVERVVAFILEEEGRIDIVVNNAGILAVGPLLDLSLDQVRQTFDTNAYSVLRMAKAVIPAMAKRKSGLIVNIGSVVAESSTPWNGIYCASKAALHSISEVLWMECKPFNIDVMLVAPAAVKSNISANHSSVFRLPPDSLYSSYLKNMRERMNASQQWNPMPTDVFAKQVVSKALRRKPPQYMIAGSGAFNFSVLRWLPRIWVLWYMWRIFSKK